MNALALEAISISNFRSIRGTIALPLDAQVVLLHGTNGAGKTSVLSALELALTGEVAELRRADRVHLIHRDAGVAAIELTTPAEAVRFRLEPLTIEGSPLLSPDDARFFTERCYLTQRTLGQLLEIYQKADAQRDSALTRFVQELLRLDELDALLEGLDAVRDKRLVKNLVPEYARVESGIEIERAQLRRAEGDLKTVAADAATSRAKIGEVLAELDAPAAVQDEPEAQGTASRWLEAIDEEKTLLPLLATRQELAAHRSRWDELASTQATRDLAAAETRERAARVAADTWWRSHGATLEALLGELRTDFPGLPSAVALSDPSDVHKTALEQVATEVERLTAVLTADDRALAEIERLDVEIAKSNARMSLIDEQLASSEPASAAEQLGQTLASLVPHFHGEDCPVCGRDYSEISSEPLSAHLASRISELGERAERLQSLAKAHLEAAGDLCNADDARKAVAARRIEPAEKVAMEAKNARLKEAHRRLTEMADGVAAGAALIRQAVEAERARALVQEQDRASADLRITMAAMVSSMRLLPLDDSTPLDDAIARLEDHVATRIEAIESREALRQTARRQLDDLAERLRVQRELQASVEEKKTAVARMQGAIEALERLRELMRTVRSEAEAHRTSIVRRVFNSSLNRTWRDLFVRLAPDEPFIPSFSVPATAERVTANLETVHRDGKPGGSPAAMLSAGNLNTAALTLFLALHLSAEPRLPLLVLDDPVQSMDEVHISQFAALLRTLSKEHGRRLMISVHEQQLFEYLTLELSPAQPGDSLVTVQLSRSRDGASIAQPEFFAYKEDTALAAV